VGVAVCFAAMLVGLVELLALRPPRATGFGSRHRWSGLAGIASQAGDLTEEALRRGGQASALGEALERAGLDLRPGELVMIVAASAVAALAGGWLVLGPVPGLALAALVVATAKATVTRLAARRRNRFADQLGETLQLLAGSMRAGHGLAQALDTVGVESESPTAEEFRRLTVETRLGRTLGEALGAMAERMQSADFEWVVQAIEINREVGGDLAEIFDRVGATIRDRNRLRRQVSALSAEGRMSAIVLVCLPFALAGIMAVTNRGYLNELFTSTVGLGMLGAGAALLVAGGAWLRRIIQIDY
jgi:tight adherence protein B